MLSAVQRDALRLGSSSEWRGTRENGVQGSTMQALGRRGLAFVRESRKPYKRLVYRLTPEGAAARARRFPITVATEEEARRSAPLVAAIERRQRELGPAFAELAGLMASFSPAVSEGVTCRCTHCGAVFEDATPGGSCGRCGLEVAPV